MIASAPSLDLGVVWEALRTIASEGDQARLPAVLARAAVDATGALEAYVLLGAGEHWTVAAHAVRDAAQASPPGSELARFAPLESAVVREAAHSRRPALQAGPPPLLCAPMLGGGGVAGVLCLLASGPGFAAEGQRVAEMIALQGGAALAPLPATAPLDDRAQEQRLLERIQAAVVVHGADTAVVSCNAHARALLGLAGGEALGRTASDPGWFFLREDGSRMPPHEYPVCQVAARRQPLRNLVAGVRRTGQAPDVWVMVNADPVFDAQGRIVETIVTFVDITEHRRSEQAYVSLVNTIDGIVWEAALPDMRIVFVSPQAERVLGYPLERWREEGFWARHIHPDDRDWMTDLPSAAADGAPTHEFFYRFRAADGRLVWLHDRVTVIVEDGRATRLRGVMVDITARRRLEMMERMRAGALEKLIRGDPLQDILDWTVRSVEAQQPPMLASVMLLDAGRRYLEPAACPSLPAFYAEGLRKLEIGPQAGACGAAAHGARRVLSVDIPADPKWERWRELAARAGLAACWSQPVFDRRGQVIGTVALYHREPRAPNAQDLELLDAMASLSGVVVEYCHAQDELRALNAELEQRVAERTADLKVARDAAEAASRAKGEFLANMSHEIRTPMNAIIGLSHLAMQSGLSPRQHNYVQKVHASAESLLGIINDILDFSKIEAGKLDFESIAFDLGDVLDDLAGVVGLKADEKNLELVFVEPDDLPTALVGDPSRLRQVLLNLCNNAVKFTERGEVVVSVRAVECGAGEVRLAFAVRDTGVGITAEQLQRLFQPFNQADASTSRRFGGTGLGLAISGRLVALMGGNIEVSSAPGQGSEFRFELRFGLQPAARRAARELHRGTLAASRALVVDDNNCAREVLTGMLASLGLRVDAAAGGDDALQRIARADAEGSPYELVLLDWKMPGMDGLECAALLGRLPLRGRRAPAVLMLTAFSRDEVLQRAQQHGLSFADVLTKPVTPSSLFDACCRALDLAPVAPSRGARREGRLSGAQAALRGARLLLVEDNAINRELALDLLTGAGITVKVAEHGQEALDILARERFDGVLMDCQMPVMDGFAATRAIRQQAQWRDLPVIAMTANAMVGDREKVLAAGMNDHIAKPINVDEMFATLARWVRPSAELESSAVAATERMPELPGIDTEAALADMRGNVAMYRRLLRQFCEQQADFAQVFNAARTSGDAETAGRLVHDLKGLAGALGMQALREATMALEQAWRNHAPAAEVDARLQPAAQRLEQVIAALSRAGIAPPPTN